MIVVSDTTTLNYLVIINTIHVLPQLFNEIHAPPAVLNELMHRGAPEAVRQWAQSPPTWLIVRHPIVRLPSTARLGPGEADAISLAKEMHIVDILIDERRGSRVARSEGLFPIPTLAIIERAAENSLLDLPNAIKQLQQTTIRIHQYQMDGALVRDAARKKSRS